MFLGVRRLSEPFRGRHSHFRCHVNEQTPTSSCQHGLSALVSLLKSRWTSSPLLPRHGLGSDNQAEQNMLTRMPTTDDHDSRLKDRFWMYGGYPQFSKWMGSSNDGVVLRRFDELHARTFLKMQDDIVRLEEELCNIDQNHMKVSESAVHNNGSFRLDEKLRKKNPTDPKGRRCVILTELEKRLSNYDQMILNYRQLRSDPEPSHRVVENVRKYLTNRGYKTEDDRRKDPSKTNRGPISDKESAFIYQDGDLLALVPKENQPLRRIVEKCDKFMLGWWFRESSQGTKQYTDIYGTTCYQSDAKIDSFITGLTLILGLTLLVGPLQLLDRLETVGAKLNAICGLIAGFMLVMVLVMPARPWETLGATAAYSAVLMVFMQIQTPSPAS